MRQTILVSIARFAITAVVFLVIPFVAGCVQPKDTREMIVVAEVQNPSAVQDSQLEPGLSVLYFHEFYRYMYQMPKGDAIARKGEPGPPIMQLNHRFGKGIVFDSGESKGVGMVMKGYFHLQQPGQYEFQALSNDGFELSINNQLLISDPEVHSDKLSDPGRFTISEGGWFPVSIKYFQRKGTATLILYWKPPGTDTFTVIPPQVYAHLPVQ